MNPLFKAALLCFAVALLLLILNSASTPRDGANAKSIPSSVGMKHKPGVSVGKGHVSPYARAHVTPGLQSYYASIWGVDRLLVRLINSGNLVRFSAHVVNAERAKSLADERATPYLIARRSGAALQVPQMENVGKLRQISAIENGHDVWMVFSNKGFPVKSGDRVDVAIGDFRVENLIVE